MEYSLNLFIILALMLWALSYLIKLILKLNGYQVNWFFTSAGDIRKLWALVGKTKVSNKKIIYLFFAIIYPLLILSFIIYGILHVNGF